jgi:hypothetical protein
MAQRLPQGHHIIADKSSHWIMQDQPEIVIAAITEIAQSAVAPESTPPAIPSPITSEFIK